MAHRLIVHLRWSIPPLWPTLLGSACWALVMTASALVVIWSNGWQTPQKFETVAILYALGAMLAFPIALFAARFMSLGRSAEIAFAAMFVSLSLLTVGMTAAIFAREYRSYYATWHADFPTITWVYQLVFTTGNAVVQFAVLGVPLFFPIGFAALFLVSIWFARDRALSIAAVSVRTRTQRSAARKP